MTSYVVADLGGTNIRLARLQGLLQEDPLEDVESFRTRDFPGLVAVLRHYLQRHRLEDAVVCLAVASPVQGDMIKMTNLDWRFSRTQVKGELALKDLLVINDFAAVAMAVPFLGPEEKLQVGSGAPAPGKPIAVCGPGTGLGVAHLAHTGERWLVLDGEGGHVDFAQTDELEQEVFNLLRREYGHVSAERILSGPGLVDLYRSLCRINQAKPEDLEPAEISRRAVAGDCPHCRLTLARFCAMLGSCCGNLALTLATVGGVYIAGGIIPANLDFFLQSEFRQRFEAKGRYRSYNAAIPTFVITAPDPGLSGAAAHLRQHLVLKAAHGGKLQGVS